MNVLVLANDMQKQELLALPLHNTIEIIWNNDTADIAGHNPFDACIDLLFDNNIQRVEWLEKSGFPLIIINSVITTLKNIHHNFVRINAWNTFLKRPVLEASASNPVLKAKAEEFFLKMGRKTEWVDDIIGFITPRVVASIINEAFFALQENVSTQEEIDIAMKSGTNYPYGPFEWSRIIGLKNIYSLLIALVEEQDRYQPAALLKQKALAP